MAETARPPAIRRKDPWDFQPWKPGELRRPSTGSAASDVFPHLPSKMNAPPVKPPEKGKQTR